MKKGEKRDSPFISHLFFSINKGTVPFSRNPCLVFLNGEIENRGIVLESARLCRKNGGTVICADGGLRHALALKIKPDVVIGDMDSLPRPLPSFGSGRILFVCDFDEGLSDFEKIIRWIAARGFKTVYVAGALGRGLDHTLVNLAIIERLSPRTSLVLLGQGLGFLLGEGRYRFSLKKGERFSLLGAPEAELSLSGARYDLKRSFLRSPSHGLGNVARGEISLRIFKGRAWFVTDSKMP